jgi:hypothetical protein
MLEKLLSWGVLKKTVVAGVGALVLGLSGCGDTVSESKNYDVKNFVEHSSYEDDFIDSESEADFKKPDLYCNNPQTFYLDQDNDGYPVKGGEEFCEQPDEGWLPKPEKALFDCDDLNPNVNHGMQEICNGIDDNCMNGIDEGFPLSKWYADNDGDGFGDPDNSQNLCDPLEGYVKDNKDCDDSDYDINPNAIEICDNKDNDCDGKIDENLSKPCSTSCGSGNQKCESGKWQECDAPKPGVEICDGIDNNCNGYIDEGFGQQKWYEDADGDGFGDSNSSNFSCEQLPGFVSNNQDCNDFNVNVNPNAIEICNGIDDNCDGLEDLKYDAENCNVSYDFAFVIDNSGSMGQGTGSPKSIAYKGLENLVKGSWLPNHKAIVVPFGTSYQIFEPFTSIVDNSDPAINSIVEYIQAAKSALVGGGTYIGPAMQEAMNHFPNQHAQAIILLTDGETSWDDPVSVGTLNSNAKLHNIEICALGLGSVDMGYLNSLTNGVGGAKHVYQASEIPEFFQKAYLSLTCEGWFECNNGNWAFKSTSDAGNCGIE